MIIFNLGYFILSVKIKSHIKYSMPTIIMALEARIIDCFQIAVFLTHDRTY